MVITNISYSKVFPLAPYCNEKISLDAQLDEDDNVATAMASLKKQVEELHRQNNPQLWGEQERNTVHPVYGKYPLTEDEVIRPTKTAYDVLEDHHSNQIKAQEKMTGMTIDEYPKTLAEQIRSCKELKVLESYKLLIQKDEQAKAAYLEMLEKLSKVNA